MHLQSLNQFWPSTVCWSPLDSLAGLQGVEGQSHSFVEHIQTGVKHAEADPSSLLLFSGGQTRRAAGPRSEAEGYWMVAAAAGWWGHHSVQDRAFTEVPLPAPCQFHTG